ncbi:alpha/beta fold hydrolase [Pseudomonas sp. DP-17]|uniref:alpha/beta fold hydrolase n=1 Tax=Pseudomonas sp. DP-17 TaxID=1580486 RepID=UPI001EFB2585|nr:alpha/beta fold hydrolase [Pseudomonas sp. DP-17]MCG8906843.1 alpha/beta fold hydrolase [Pseudomonas sp. DP-17]
MPFEKTFTGRLKSEARRMLKRRLNALDYISSPGPKVGETPKRLLHRRGTLSLYHYQSTADEVYRVPLLLVMATTNRAYLFDLAKGQSLIEFLLHRGYDIYVIDWNPPTRAEQHLKIENYVLDFLPDCLRRVQQDSGVEEVTLVGYCMAGILSCIYAALHPQGPLKNLVCFTTPVDWSQVHWTRAVANPDYFDVDELADRLGIIPSKMIQNAFDLLRPAGRIAGQLRLWDNLWNDQYVKGYRMMTGWGADTLPLAGDYYRQIVKELVWQNGLFKDSLRIGGRAVRLDAIKVPLLHVIAEHDTLVPPASAQPLLHKVSSVDKEELIIPGGHVSLVAGPAAIKRMWPSLDHWLGKRSV